MGTAGNAAARRQIYVATLQSDRGGGKRDRTADLLHAMQALSQLSYTPTANIKLYGLGAASANETPARGRAPQLSAIIRHASPAPRSKIRPVCRDAPALSPEQGRR